MPEREFVRRDFEIQRGIKWSESFVVKDADGAAVDLTAHTVTAVLNATNALDGTLVVAITTTIDDADAGEVTLSLTEAQTTALTAARLAGFVFVYYSGASTGNLKMPIYAGRATVK